MGRVVKLQRGSPPATMTDMNDTYSSIRSAVGEAAAAGRAFDASPAETRTIAEALEAAAERDTRLRSAILRLDHRIEALREQVQTWAGSVADAAADAAARAADADSKPRVLGRSSAGAQLDEAIVELNALVEERKMLAYVTGEGEA